jgi:kynurenine formamidase
MHDRNTFRTIIDLTHVLNDRSPNWEGSEESPFQSTELGNIERDGYYSRIFTTQEHYGTHLDAPAHFAAGAWTVDQIPADRLVGPLAVIDVHQRAASNPDYEVSVDDINTWEEAYGHIPSGSVVIAYTGWDKRWETQKSFRNEQADGLTHYPGFSLAAAMLLANSRAVVGLGIDTMSVDIGATTTFPVHLFTSQQNIYHLENVANLATVPPAGALIVVAPIKLEKGSGGQVRLLALVG